MDAAASRELFDRNAPSYDRVNTLISLGLDRRWRRWVSRRAVAGPGVRVLDAFAGTGLVGVEAAALGAEVTLADASPEMLAGARRHAAARGVRVREAVVDLAGPVLPLPSGAFDAVTCSFGLRYLDDPAAVLGRLCGLLAPGGRLVVLEFVRADGGLVSRAASVYFFCVLPRLASALAGHGELYDYLASSTQAIGTRRDVEDIVRRAGYDVAEEASFGFGLVAGLVCLPSP